jgi:hypothetical protein
LLKGTVELQPAAAADPAVASTRAAAVAAMAMLLIAPPSVDGA